MSFEQARAKHSTLFDTSPNTDMHRKNLALEVALVVFALIAAFVVQGIIAQTKPPTMPDFPVSDKVEDPTEEATLVVATEPKDEKPLLRIPKVYDEHQSSLGEAPDWSQLDRYQYSVTKQEFTRLLEEVYTVGDDWKQWFVVNEGHVQIRMRAADDDEIYTLSFKEKPLKARAERFWRKKSELEQHTDERPLAGLRLAIDPGHIGGNFAHLEERRFALAEGSPPVQEGNMTLTVASLLVDQLEALGATVTLLRDTNNPVNPFRVEDYFAYAKAKMKHQNLTITKESLQREAAQLFYRNGEIRARSMLVNHEIKPDLVLCLHFNAAAQANPLEPQLIEDEHFHMILNGAYTTDELAHDDERFKMVLKILQGVHAEEAALSKYAAQSFVEETNLPAYRYSENSGRAVNIDGDPYLWARNLLANRLYDCPVVYYEPYLQNGKDSYVRMQMGDYQGLRYVNGKMRPSIFREYVNAVTKGLVAYYTHAEPEPELEPGEVPSLLEIRKEPIVE